MAPKVYIVMAVFRPDLRFLDEQIASILRQSHKELELIIVPDGPDPELEARLAQLEGTRVRIFPQTHHVGIYRNFMRGLSLALWHSRSERDLFAYCDQDDIWTPDKLARQCREMNDPGVAMCYGDARVVDEQGHEIGSSLFALEQRTPHRSFNELMIVNDVTGATMAFTKAVAWKAVHGPAGDGNGFLHDWWTSLVAARMGRTVFLSEPLISYRKHGSNVIGPQKPPAAVRRERKRPFLSRAYLRMCGRQFSLRQELLYALDNTIVRNHASAGPACMKSPDRTHGVPILSIAARMPVWRLGGRHTLVRHAARLMIGRIVAGFSIAPAGKSSSINTSRNDTPPDRT